MPMSTKCQKMRTKRQLMSYNMMIGYVRLFYNGAFSTALKNDLDDQNLLLATLHYFRLSESELLGIFSKCFF
jgi:hypothetical protein